MTSSEISPPQRRIVITFSVTVFFFSLSAWIVAVYLPIYLDKVLRLSRPNIGFLISLYAVTLIVLVGPLGHLSDRVSPKRIVQVGLLLFAAYGFLLTGAKTLPVLTLVQLLGGIGNSLVVIALQSLYYKHLTPSRRGRKVGAYMFSTFFGLGVGPLLSGFLLKSCGLSYRIVFLTAGGVMSGLLLFSQVLKDSPPFRMRLLDYREDVFRKEVFLLICMLLAMGIHYGNERVSLSLFMKNVIRLDDLAIGSVFAVLGFWIAAMAVVAGTLFDRTKKLLLFICAGLVLSGFSHMGTAYAGSYGSVLLARILHTTGDSVVIFSTSAIIASIFPAKRMGGNYGFTSFFSMQGAFLGALASGFLDGHCGYRASFIVTGSATVLVGILLAANWRTVLNLSNQLSK